MPYKIASRELPGLAKLAEECAEVSQDACKIMGGSNSPEMLEHLMDEMGDVYAALRFFIDNNPDVKWSRVAERANEKSIRWDAKRAKGAKTHG